MTDPVGWLALCLLTALAPGLGISVLLQDPSVGPEP
jgi:hypothetical protein